MPLYHTTKVYAVKQAKIYKITLDSAGVATAYGTGFVLTGARELQVTETFKEAYLRGDNQLLDYEAIRETVKAKLRHGKLVIDAVSIITGSTIADTGSTPNQKVTNTYAPTDSPSFFKIEAQCWSVDGTPGDYHVVLGKAKVAGSRVFGLVEEAFQEYTFEMVAVPPVGTGSVWYQEVLNETAIAIA